MKRASAHVVKLPETPEERRLLSCWKVVDRWDESWFACPNCKAIPDKQGCYVHQGPLEQKYSDRLC